MDKMTNIAVVMACNEDYAMPLATALRSLVESNRAAKSLEICVLTSNFSTPMRQKVLSSLPKGSAWIHWVPVDLASFEGFLRPPGAAWVSQIAYARLLLPQFFPDSVLRVVYLDADILVQQDLGPLWEVDLEGAAFGAADDTYWTDRTRAQFTAERLGLNAQVTDRKAASEAVPDRCQYFNAGVLLVDLVRWREEQISEKAMRYMACNPLLADQDALNVACGGRWKKLDVQWNFQDHDPAGYSLMRPEQRPAIIHFAGKWKPWNPSNPDVNFSFYDEFRERTRFARTPVEKTCDTARRSWAFLKRFLKQYKVVCQVRDYFVRQRPLGGVN